LLALPLQMDGADTPQCRSRRQDFAGHCIVSVEGHGRWSPPAGVTAGLQMLFGIVAAGMVEHPPCPGTGLFLNRHADITRAAFSCCDIFSVLM